MRIKIKINPKTRVVYLPKDIVESGFNGEVDAFGAGSVFVITHPNADVAAIKESISLVLKDIDLTPHSRSRDGVHLTELQEVEKSKGGGS